MTLAKRTAFGLLEFALSEIAWLLPRTAADEVTELLGPRAECWLTQLACGVARVEKMDAGQPPPLLSGGIQRLIESMRWLRPGYPRLRVVRAGELLPPGAYMTGTGSSWVRNSSLRPNAAVIDALLGDGATVVLDEADQHFPELGTICAAVSDLTGFAAWANAYLNTNGGSGFGEHFDDHDVLAVQCEGSRTWCLSEVQHQLVAGAAIAIPEGVSHVVEPSPTASLHVSIALRRARVAEAVTDALGAQAADPVTPFGEYAELCLRPRLKRTHRRRSCGGSVEAGWSGPLGIQRSGDAYSLIDGPDTLPLSVPVVRALATMGRRYDPWDILPPSLEFLTGAAITELLSLRLLFV
jgi:hypothetical protein